jgi:ketosteroid isomerase-like protein
MKWISLLAFASVLSAATGSKAETDVMAAMDAWKQATIHKDGAALEKLLHPDLTYTHSSGMTQTKADVLQAVLHGKASVEDIQFSNTTVHIFGNTAIVKGTVDIKNNNAGKVSDAHLDIVHVWLKGPQGWQMVVRHAVRLTAAQ